MCALKFCNLAMIQVSSIMANGPAAVSGLVNEGDLLIAVNGASIDGMTDRESISFSSCDMLCGFACYENFSLNSEGECGGGQIPTPVLSLAHISRHPLHMVPEQLARNLLGPLGSKVALGLQKADGRRIEAELSRAFTSKQRAAAISVDGNKGS